MKKTLFLSLLLSTLLPVSSPLVRADDYTGWQNNGYDWELVFSDDFDGDSLDSHNWTRIPYATWGNSDWRLYQSINADDDLVEITDSGTIKLWAKYGEYATQRDTTLKEQYACGSIWSDTTFRFHYGYMEVKARYDSATGVWPAIWLMSGKSGIWPSTGEIDLMEHLNWNQLFYSTLHYLNDGGSEASPSVTTTLTDYGSGWHTYGVEWVEDRITIYMDGNAIAVFNNNSSLWPFNDADNEFYIILSNQIGGNWVMGSSTGGNGNIGPIVQQTGVAMEIDYVHVYSSSDYNHLLVEGIWNTANAATSSGGLVTMSGQGVYKTLDCVEQVHVNGNAAFDLTGETLETDATDSSIGLLVSNLTGEAGCTLTIAGSGAGVDLVTFSNTTGSTAGNETVSLRQITANVKAEADEEGSYYTLGIGNMTLEQAALNVDATLTVGNMELAGSVVTVEEGATLALGGLEGDADSSLSGIIHLTGDAEYHGGYAEGTVINISGNAGKVILSSGSGLSLTNASKARAGMVQEGGHAVIVYGEDKSINHIALTGTTVTLDNVGSDGSMSTLQLLNDSSITNGTLAFSAYAHEMVASAATAITSGAALDLTGTQVVVNILGDQGSTALAMEANGQTTGITLLEVAEELERDENTTIAFTGSLASMLYRYYANIHWVGGSIVADRVMNFYSSRLGGGHNVQAGASLLDNELLHVHSQPSPDVSAAMDALDSYLSAGHSEAASNLAAAVAGASIATLGSAFSGDVERQLRAIRNRTTTMGVDPSQLDEDMPCFNAWVNAEGDYRKMEQDGTAAGYTLSSWGGTVGLDVDISPNLTAGLAVTAMYGDLDSKGPDRAEGDFDTYYVSLFARYASRSWTHTFVGTVGWLDASLDRTVSHAGGSYKTSGDTEGVGFGLMYEVGYVIPLNEDSTACLQPVFNVTWRHIGVDGYSESGSDAGLRADDQSMDVVTFGLGARFQSVIAENIYNRTALFEARALLKVDAGDRQSDLDVSLLRGATSANIESAEIGAVGVELGAGLTIPVGAEGGAFFIDGSAELRNGYTNLNGTVGYRMNF